MRLSDIGHPDRLLSRFWAKVQRSEDPAACWIWTGNILKVSGYGRLSVRLRGRATDINAHRISYMLEHGEVDDTLFVCHACDNRLCVRPSHLWVGTSAENNTDRSLKGRSARGDASGARLHPESHARGDASGRRRHPGAYESLKGDANPARRIPGLRQGVRNGRARVKEEQARAIRARCDQGEVHLALAREYGVSPSLIDHIAARITWKHLP